MGADKGCCGCSDESLRIWRVRYVGLSFWVLFSGFQAAQTLVTPLFKSVGTIALTLLYVFFAIGAVFAPFIAAKLGFRYRLEIFVGSLARRPVAHAALESIVWLIYFLRRLNFFIWGAAYAGSDRRRVFLPSCSSCGSR